MKGNLHQSQSYHDDIFEPSSLEKFMSATLIPPPHLNHIQNILNVREIATLTQRTNREPVTAVTIGIAEVNVARWAVDRQAIVSIEDDIVLE
jgi:hypothetical protein